MVTQPDRLDSRQRSAEDPRGDDGEYHVREEDVSDLTLLGSSRAIELDL